MNENRLVRIGHILFMTIPVVILGGIFLYCLTPEYQQAQQARMERAAQPRVFRDEANGTTCYIRTYKVDFWKSGETMDCVSDSERGE